MNNKRYYVDVKQNWRGRYIKLAEASGGANAGRRKTRVLLSMPLIAPMCDNLEKLEKNDKASEKKEEKGGDGPTSYTIEELTLAGEDRDYKLMLKENKRGRFVLISMTISPSATLGRRDNHSQVAISQEGIKELVAALRELGEKWNKDLPEDKSYKGPMPEPTNFRVGNKMYYFDYGQNARGVFMRISEVKPAWRTSVTVPRSEWGRFREVFEKAHAIVDEVPEMKLDVKPK
jgi:hypothetical protein